MRLHLLKERTPQNTQVKTHRRKTFHLQAVRVLFQNTNGHQKAHGYSRREEAIQMQAMHIQVCISSSSQKPYSVGSQWREALYLQLVLLHLLTEGFAKTTYANPYRREALCLQLV